jgi:hypothetical protein
VKEARRRGGEKITHRESEKTAEVQDKVLSPVQNMRKAERVSQEIRDVQDLLPQVRQRGDDTGNHEVELVTRACRKPVGLVLFLL